MSRTSLKPIVSTLRESIIKGIAGKLEKYGFNENGELTVEKPLSSYDETLRSNLCAYFQAKNINDKKSYIEYIQNTSRTFLHVLICFKLMEKRKIMGALLENMIETNIYDEVLPSFISVNPVAFDEFVSKYSVEIEKLTELDNEEEPQEYYQFIYLMQSLSREVSKEVPLLFKDFEFNIVQPDYDDIKGILKNIYTIDDNEFYEDDFLGWIYQYWVDTDDSEIEIAKQQKDISYADTMFFEVLKLLDNEQTEYGEFYTPRWVVKYIVDNAIAQYRKKGLSRIEDIKLLDPACGAGNFLVYTFDALYNVYLEEHPNWGVKQIVESILEKNIYGADIQREPLQISALNLWIKAKSCAVKANVNTLNLFNVNILRANALYKWETEEEYHQMSLFEDINVEERKYTSEDIGRLLTNQEHKEHNTAIRFFKNRFEIVIMNPPFVDTRKMNSDTKSFLGSYYPDNARNLFGAFIQRAFELTSKEGIIGFVSSDTWMTIGSFEKIRSLILENSLIKKCLHLGFGVFDGADVSGVVFLLDKHRNLKENSEFIDLKEEEIKTENNGIKYVFNQKSFKNIEGTPFIYELKPGLRKAFEKAQSLGNGIIADVYSGLQVKMDNGYVFKKWDVYKDERYASFAYDCIGKYYSELNYVIDWSEESVNRLKKESKEKGYHHSVLISSNADKYLFRKGILYSAGGSRFYSRVMDDNTIFYVGESAVFINDEKLDIEYVLGLMNSRFADYILNLLNPSKNFQVGDISRIPFVYPTKEIQAKVVDRTQKLIALQKRLYSFDYKSEQFIEDEISFGIGKGADSIREAYEVFENEYKTITSTMETLQNEIDELIFDTYELNKDERDFILDRFSNNINQFNKMNTIEYAVLRYLGNIAKNSIKGTAKLYDENDLLNLLRKYFDDSFGLDGYKKVEECEDILGKSLVDVIRSGIKIGSKTVDFAGDITSMEEPFLVAKKLAGRGNNKVSIYWYKTDFLFVDEGKKYAFQNEIRRMAMDVFMPQLQRAKEQQLSFSGKGVEKKNLEKTVEKLEECIKTLENWKVVD